MEWAILGIVVVLAVVFGRFVGFMWGCALGLITIAVTIYLFTQGEFSKGFGIFILVGGFAFVAMLAAPDDDDYHDPMSGKRRHYDKDGKLKGYSDRD